MPRNSKTTGVYSSGELVLIRWFHVWKDAFFSPVLRFLSANGATPNALSIFSAAVASTGFLFAVFLWQPLWFIGGIWLHLLLDGLDGSLARLLRSDTLFGSYMDVVCDQVGIISACAYMLVFRIVDPVLVLFFGIFYILVIASSFFLGSIHRPLRYVLRPRIIVFASITAEYFLSISITTPILLTLTLLLALSTAEGLIRIGTYIHNRSL